MLLLLCALSRPARAEIVEVGGRPLSYQPVPARAAGRSAVPSRAAKAGQPLEDNGGPVMTSNTNYALYWQPAGAPAYPSGYVSGIDRYFEDLAHDSGSLLTIDSVLAQYTQNGGEAAAYDSAFGGALLDTDPYPASGCAPTPPAAGEVACFTEEQLRTEIAAYVTANGLPEDLQHEYFLITPPGVESCAESNGKRCSDGTSHPFYCAYHNYIPLGKGVVLFADIPDVYGLSCDPGSGSHPNGSPSDAAIAGGLVHEHAESVTDPELNAWYDSKKEEVADKCQSGNMSAEYGAPLGTAPDGSPYNQLIDGDEYYYQQVWSNEAGECLQRRLSPPAITKLAPKSGPAEGGTSVTITGTGFTAGATVAFGTSESPSVTYESSHSLRATAPAGIPKAAVYVTVTTSAGTSPQVKKGRFKYKR